MVKTQFGFLQITQSLYLQSIYVCKFETWQHGILLWIILKCIPMYSIEDIKIQFILHSAAPEMISNGNFFFFDW